jgi:hypothetical protein
MNKTDAVQHRFCYTSDMIKKVGSKYRVVSETTGRSFGTYATKKEAQKRLQQMEFFKHLKGSPSLRGKLRKKSLLKKQK